MSHFRNDSLTIKRKIVLPPHAPPPLPRGSNQSASACEAEARGTSFQDQSADGLALSVKAPKCLIMWEALISERGKLVDKNLD